MNSVTNYHCLKITVIFEKVLKKLFLSEQLAHINPEKDIVEFQNKCNNLATI